MELMKGYKHTELGLIPEEWNISNLGTLAEIKDGTHQTPKYVDFGIPFYSVEHVTSGNFKDTKYITEEEHKFLTKRHRIENGDVLMTRIGSIGDCKLVDWSPDASFYVSLALLKFENKTLAKYFVSFSKSILFKNELDQNSLLHAIPKKINLGKIANLQILIPTRKEVELISETFSDMDSYISNLKKLIEKKKAIKQGAMQELLTGKKRLVDSYLNSGYKQTNVGLIPIDWKLITYEEAFYFLKTATYSRAELTENDDFGYIHYGDIHTSWNNHLDLKVANLPSIPHYKVKNYTLVSEGDIVMADASEDYSGVGKSVEITNLDKKRIIAGLHTFLLRDKAGHFSNGFKGFIHQIPIVSHQYFKLATGMKVYGVSKSNLKKILIPTPPINEQIAISRVLIELEKEIQLVEKKLLKANSIKLGMMQNLLTGKIRLV